MGLEAFLANTSVLPENLFNLTLTIFFPFAEYLRIADIRKILTPRESPFVAGNNAGGGFGKDSPYFIPSISSLAALMHPTLSNSLISSFSFVPAFYSWRHGSGTDGYYEI